MRGDDVRRRLAAAGVYASQVDGRIRLGGSTSGQFKGPVWRGPLPRNVRRRVPISSGYSPAWREHNEAIDARRFGLGVEPGSGLARFLAEAPRGQRRLVLAGLQSRNPRRRARIQRQTLKF